MLKNDPLENILYIDLTRRTFRIEKRPELFEKYLGGTGVAIHLLHEECPEGAIPWGRKAPSSLPVAL
jgi:aldehyde:ferredoxin oxidoreductase